MRKWILLTALVAACGDDGAGSESNTRVEQCEQARSHLVELRLAGSEALGKIELQKHREAFTAALGTQFLDACATRLNDQQVACLLAATDSDDINACHAASSGH